MLKWFVLAFLIPVFYLIRGFIRSSTPFGFARELARAQLKALNAVQGKWPDKPVKELYQLALQTRPGYTPEAIADIITMAEVINRHFVTPFSFRVVVLQLAAHEFIKRTESCKLPPRLPLDTLRAGVDSLIPEHL